MEKRLDYIDALKGFAILLVVFGHSIQVSVPHFDENIFFRLIYSFHMPMFMFLSGFVAFYSSDFLVTSFLKKKFLLLGVPFFSWYGVSYFVSGSFSNISILEYVQKIIISPDYGLWFLWVLLLNFLFFVIAIKMEKFIGISSYLITLLGIIYLPTNLFGLGFVKIYFVYFIVGYLIMRYRFILKKYFNLAQIVSLVIFFGLAFQWQREKGFGFASEVLNGFASNGMIFMGDFLLFMLKFILVISGIIVSFIVIRLLMKYTIFYKYLCKLGNYTLDIYVSHQYFLSFSFGVGAIKIFSSATISLGLSLFLSFFFLRRIGILNFLFLGGRKLVFNKN